MDAINHPEALRDATSSLPTRPSMQPGQVPCTPCSASSLPEELLWRIFLALRASSGDLMIRRQYDSRPKTHWICHPRLSLLACSWDRLYRLMDDAACWQPCLHFRRTSLDQGCATQDRG
jgi:hypothetical protein